MKTEEGVEYCLLPLFAKEDLRVVGGQFPQSSRAKVFVLENGKLVNGSRNDYKALSSVPNIGILPIALWRDMNLIFEQRLGLTDIEMIVRPVSKDELLK